jgi:hypothetical protein
MKIGNNTTKDIIILLAIGLFSYAIIKPLKTEYCGEELKICIGTLFNKIYSIATNSKDIDSFKNDIKNEFSNTASHVLDNKSSDEKIYSAANFLWGNYIRNTVIRAKYCSNIGVEIPEFSLEFRENNKEVYRKMSTQALKTLVITKGLSSDTSKMKKNDLLKLLESEI